MKRLESKNIIWAVTGSLRMAFKGVPVIPNDIDIQTDEIGAYKIQKLFKDHVTKPVTFCGDDSIKLHFGSLVIFGVQVESKSYFRTELGNLRLTYSHTVSLLR
jgi:hypothetical protein